MGLTSANANDRKNKKVRRNRWGHGQLSIKIPGWLASAVEAENC